MRLQGADRKIRPLRRTRGQRLRTPHLPPIRKARWEGLEPKWHIGQRPLSFPSRLYPPTPPWRPMHWSCYSLHECTIQHDLVHRARTPTHPPAGGTRAPAHFAAAYAETHVRLPKARGCRELNRHLAWSSRRALASPRLESRGARVASRPSWTTGLTSHLGRSWPQASRLRRSPNTQWRLHHETAPPS